MARPIYVQTRRRSLAPVFRDDARELARSGGGRASSGWCHGFCRGTSAFAARARRDLSVGRVPGVEDARDGSLAGMFDHVGIAVADLAASERFYRTVLSALGVEPS